MLIQSCSLSLLLISDEKEGVPKNPAWSAWRNLGTSKPPVNTRHCQKRNPRIESRTYWVDEPKCHSEWNRKGLDKKGLIAGRIQRASFDQLSLHG